ncbi:MAG: 23S rRNA (adenine(1618)-N(6))-methyltransferase RlmF [Lysobacter sp.]
MTAAPEPPAARTAKPAARSGAAVGLHPRNRHQGRYDFALLTAACPELSAFLIPTPAGDTSLDFGNPHAVRALNRALLKVQYGVAHWDIPEGYLCPPIPGRADYLHGLADLLAEANGGVIPRGPVVRALDIGVGANCIYPLLGHAEYGWRFVGSEVEDAALRSAAAIVQANPGLGAAIELRHQPERGEVFAGLLRPDEAFDLTLCNPPFHASAKDAARGSRRKWQQLGKPTPGRGEPSLNFGGQATELWCTGGEASFVRRMVRESAAIAPQVLWFSTLVAKSEHLADVRRQLHKAGAQEVREMAMAQGSKQSRFVAWSFHDAGRRVAWAAARWN